MSKKLKSDKPSVRVSAEGVQTALDAVERLDRQITQATEESLTEPERKTLLNYVHRDLIVQATVMYVLDRDTAGAIEECRESLIASSDEGVELVRRILTTAQGDWDFELNRVLTEERTSPLGDELVEWLHKRLIHTAQRTRLHTDAEIAAIIKWADAELICCSICLNLRSSMEPKSSPLAAVFHASVIGFAVTGCMSLDWNSTRVFLDTVKATPFPEHLLRPKGKT